MPVRGPREVRDFREEDVGGGDGGRFEAEEGSGGVGRNDGRKTSPARNVMAQVDLSEKSE